MRKKLLTVALAAIMVLGSTFSVLAVDSPNTDSPELNDSPSTGGVEADADDVAISDEAADAIEKDAKVEGIDGIKLYVNAPTKAVIEAVAAAGKTLLANLKYEIADLELFKGDVQLTKLDNKIKVTLSLFENLLNAKYVAVYRLDGTTLTSLGTVEVKGGKFTFETDHFSTYVFAAASAPAADGEPATGDTAPIATAVTVAVLAAVAYGVVSFKKKEV